MTTDAANEEIAVIGGGTMRAGIAFVAARQGHGGMVSALTDTAFAHARNGRNVAEVALAASIVFPARARVGDKLKAEALSAHGGVCSIRGHLTQRQPAECPVSGAVSRHRRNRDQDRRKHLIGAL